LPVDHSIVRHKRKGSLFGFGFGTWKTRFSNRSTLDEARCREANYKGLGRTRTRGIAISIPAAQVFNFLQEVDGDSVFRKADDAVLATRKFARKFGAGSLD
jgi:hypothetical protein